MLPRLTKLGQLGMIIAMLMACGGHWVLLQSVAWTKMVADFSQDGDFKGAITKTFDGCHPCHLCKCIKAAKANEKKHEAQVVAEKLTFYHQSARITLRQPDKFRMLSEQTVEVTNRANEPPTPPPRTALV